MYKRNKIIRVMEKLRVIVLVIIVLFTNSCYYEEDIKRESTCIGGECYVQIEVGDYQDSSGYYHVNLEWNNEFLPYFPINIQATSTNPRYHYNSVPFVTGEFRSNTFWYLGDNTIFKVFYYNPLGSDYTTTTRIPTRSGNLELDLFNGYVVDIVSTSEVYFSSQTGSDMLYAKKIAGPFPPEMEGDTILVFAEIAWDAAPVVDVITYEIKIIID